MVFKMFDDKTSFLSEEVTIDYVSKIKDPLLRATCLLPWFPEPLPFDLNEEIPLGPPYPIVVQVCTVHVCAACFI